jgi:hypothetical protein
MESKIPNRFSILHGSPVESEGLMEFSHFVSPFGYTSGYQTAFCGALSRRDAEKAAEKSRFPFCGSYIIHLLKIRVSGVRFPLAAIASLDLNPTDVTTPCVLQGFCVSGVFAVPLCSGQPSLQTAKKWAEVATLMATRLSGQKASLPS